MASDVAAAAITSLTGAAVTSATGKPTSSKRLDESLWWDSFVALSEELDTASSSSDVADNLVEKLKRNHAWFLDLFWRFKPPSEASRLALESNEISLGDHRLVIKPKLKEAALRASKWMCLDEVQTYILVSRSFEHDKYVTDVEGQDFMRLVLLKYFFERQCLLKCIRRIFVNTLCMSNMSHSSDAIKREALQLIHDGLEVKLLSVLKELLSSISSEKFLQDVNLIALWVDETIFEDNLILDILFLVYYDNFCICNAVQWISLCSLFKDILGGVYSIEKLAVSVEARASFTYSKTQILLILIETLDLENLLRMVHDEVPFREGGSMFSVQDVQEMDFLVSSFSGLGMLESGPLFLAWAVFICLLSSLPDIKNQNILVEIDHVDYVRQAFDVATFNYLLEVLRSDCLRHSDGPLSGFLSILRTFISAFIASYEVSHQSEENMLSLILEILCEIYCGEEPLSVQFWDRDSFVDGPIRSLLYMLESEYPYHMVELIRLLSALCNGSWSTQCVYNFLDKRHGMTLLFEIPSDFCRMDVNDTVKAHQRMPIPGVEGVFIPPGTHGQILKVIDVNIALVHWECAHSGIYLFVLRLAQVSHSSVLDEVFLILNLLYRLLSSSVDLCFNLLHLDDSLYTQAARNCGLFESNLCIDVVRVISFLALRLVEDGRNSRGVGICISILAKMLKCAPSHVIDMVVSSNIFGTENIIPSSGTWILSGGLSRLLLADIEEESEWFMLTNSVLDFTLQLIEKGPEETLGCALIVFSIQYVFVNHLHMKCKLKNGLWKITLKVLDVMKNCVKGVRHSHKLDSMIQDILFFDSSIHSSLCRLLYVSKQELEKTYGSHWYGLKETEGLLATLCSALDIVYYLLVDISKGSTLAASPFVQTLFPSSSKSISVLSATISLMSLFSYPAIQVAASKVLSVLCSIASSLQHYSIENITFGDALQIRGLTNTICHVLDEEPCKRKDFLISVLDLLVSAAYFQPSLVLPIISSHVEDPRITTGDVNNELAKAPFVNSSSERGSAIDSVLRYVNRSELFINSDPRLLMRILNFLKALWDGGIQYMDTLEKVRNSATFWEHMSSILASKLDTDYPSEDLSHDDFQHVKYRYCCQGIVLEIMARELILQEKLSRIELNEKQASTNSLNGHGQNRLAFEALPSSTKLLQNDILSKWYEGSIMDTLLKTYSSGGYDVQIISRAKVSACILILHIMSVLSNGSPECLSLSVIGKIHMIHNKLRQNPTFSGLLEQYSFRGYSHGKDVTSLVLLDLYYHLQGELEGREISPGPFQELSGFLLDLETLQCNECTEEKELWGNDVLMYDISSISTELGIDLWDMSEWKATKEIAERMLSHMHTANLIVSSADAKNSTLKSLVAFISLHNAKMLDSQSTLTSRGSSVAIEQSIKYVCRCLQSTEDSLIPVINRHEKLLKLFTTQTEMLLALSRILFKQHSGRNNTKKLLPIFIIMIRTCGSCLKLLADIKLSNMLNKATKFFLMVLLISMEFINPNACIIDDSDLDDNELAEAYLAIVGQLPLVCRFVENNECFDLSVASMDLMLKRFLSPNTWFPILQENLHLKHLILILHQKSSLFSVTITLNFFLTLAHTKGGAEMLYSVNLFSSLKILFSQLADDEQNLDGGCFSTKFDKDDKHGHILGLGFAIISSIIHSLGYDSSVINVFDSAIHDFFAEKANLILFCLSARSLPTNDHNKKRARSLDAQTSLTTLRLAEHSLSFICLLVRNRDYRREGMKEIYLELRQKIIHLLAFISKEAQRVGDNTSNCTVPLYCLPALKEEAEYNEKPSSINSGHGWFLLSALVLSSKNKVMSESSPGLSLVTKDQANGCSQALPTYFSDVVAIQIYRIAFLLLTYLCVQAKAATERAEELGYIDLARFPDLPMPEILHGLQDQAIAIVVDVCEANRSRALPLEAQGVCLLMFQILERSLYLEFCVTQSCGIRPVLGRVEDVSREIRSLIQAVKQHKNLGASLASLMQIITFVYPGLIQTSSLV